MKEITRLIKSSIRQEATLTAINKALNDVLNRLPSHEETPEDELLHPNEVIAILKICERTLLRYRVKKLLKPAGPGGKFYLKSEVMKICDRKRTRRKMMIKRMR